MLKWIGKFFYILFVGITTFFVAYLAEASKVIEFLRAQELSNENNNLALIQSSVIGSSRGNSNAFILKEPLYLEKFQSFNDNNELMYQIEISIYALVNLNKKDNNNSIVIIFDDIIVNDSLALLNEYDMPALDIKVDFNKEIKITNYNFMLGLKKGLLFLNHDELKVENSFAELKSIKISYELKNETFKNLVTLTNNDFAEIDLDGVFDSTYNRNINNVIRENIDLISIYGTNDYTNNKLLYFDNSLTKEFNKYNTYYFKYVGILLLFLIPITYLLFFHKHVMVKYRQKKDLKYEEIKKQEEKIKKEIE